MSQTSIYLYGKAAWVGLEVGWDRVPGDLQDGSLLARLMESQVRNSLLALWFGGRGTGLVFRKGTMTSACLDSRHFSFSQNATGAF